ncbi:hypothetical protein WMY93_001565 [Mugilogobius chulae]|uniref:Carbohydrate kinase FGGY C-terminal domain-containing protein n=1 Tax=Mugilogobius chulae TaxID=88201 RepID=A0AAW0PUL5_9GOBI
MCFSEGQAKNTYGTGCFLLRNTGTKSVMSEHGLLTTVAYKLGKNQPAHYALEGSVAIAGAVVRWLRDNMGIVQSADEIEKLAAAAGTSYGCYFVPAFSGLYAPYWEPSARGIICGLTQFTNRKHLAFAALEAVCFQTREILDAMNLDSGVELSQLQVDGGMTSNRLLMQLRPTSCVCLWVSICGSNMEKSVKNMNELTRNTWMTLSQSSEAVHAGDHALGVAMAAGAAEGVEVWSLSPEELPLVSAETYEPQINTEESEFRFARWKKAVQKAMNWRRRALLPNQRCRKEEEQRPLGSASEPPLVQSGPLRTTSATVQNQKSSLPRGTSPRGPPLSIRGSHDQRSSTPEIFTIRSLHDQRFSLPDVFTIRSLHDQRSSLPDVFTIRSPHDQRSSLPDVFTIRSLHDQRSSLPDVFTIRSPHDQRSSLPEIFTTRSPHDQRSSLPEIFTTRSPHDQRSSLPDVFTIRSLHDQRSSTPEIFTTRSPHDQRSSLPDVFTTRA